MLEIKNFFIFENQEDWKNNTCADDKRIIGKFATYSREPKHFPALYKGYSGWSPFEYDTYYEEDLTIDKFLDFETRYQKDYEKAIKNLKSIKKIKKVLTNE